MIVLSKEMQEEGKEYVYLAEFVGGYCKIGVSKNPSSRLKNIEKANKVPLKRYVLVEAYFNLEKLLHQNFKDLRRYSEWFEINFEELVNYVSDLEYEYVKKEKIKKEKQFKEQKEIISEEFIEIFKKEKEEEEILTHELNEIQREIIVFLKNGIPIKKEIIINFIELNKNYIKFLENTKIKIGEEQEIKKEIEVILDFMYKLLINEECIL